MYRKRIERILFILSFCLKVNGDLRTISKNGSLLRTYYYDQAGQLTQEINHEAGTVAVYHYDAGGNLSYRNRGPYDPSHITELWKDKTYTYGDANWKDKLTAYNGKPITYDEIGNPLTYDGWTYTWEVGRQLKKQVKGNISIEYVYDENGLRTQKKTTENDKTTVYDYVWKGDRLIVLTIDAGISIEYLYFFYDEDGKAAGFVHDNKDVYFYQSDAQGNVNAIVKQDGSTAAQYTYDAWGNLLSSKGEMAKINPLTYRGYQYDYETGLYYLQSRYYNPEWGRFLNADSVFDGSQIVGNNLFTYCSNSPIQNIDENGKMVFRDNGELAIIMTGFMFWTTDRLTKMGLTNLLTYEYVEDINIISLVQEAEIVSMTLKFTMKEKSLFLKKSEYYVTVSMGWVKDWMNYRDNLKVRQTFIDHFTFVLGFIPSVPGISSAAVSIYSTFGSEPKALEAIRESIMVHCMNAVKVNSKSVLLIMGEVRHVMIMLNGTTSIVLYKGDLASIPDLNI